MTQVFISYAREDTEFVRRIYDRLVEAERDAWVDWEDIPLTADWLQEAYTGIEGANTFIFVISPASVKSGPCTLELEHALQNNKRLIPLLRTEVLDPEEAKMMHPSLSAHNWLLCRDQDDFEHAIKSILTTLDTDLDFVRAHTRYIVRAAEWEDKGHDASLLLRGSDLNDAEQWLRESQSKQPNATDIQREYIRASRLEARRRQRLTLTGIAVTVVIAGLALFAEIQRESAVSSERQARAAESTAQYNAGQADSFALASSAQQSLYRDQNTDLAIVLALEANRIDQPPPLARSILAQAAYAPGTRQRFQGYALYPDADLAFTPDHKQVLSVMADESLALWDYDTKKIEQSWTLTDRVWSIAIATPPTAEAPAQYALVALTDGTLIQLDLQTAAQKILFSQEGSVVSVAISPDGKQAFAGYEDGKVITWDIATGEEIQRYATSEQDMWTIAISPDGTIVAAGFDDGNIILWDVETGAADISITGHTGAASTLAFSPDNTQLLSGSYDNSVRLWDVATGTQLQQLSGHKDRVRRVVFSSDGKTAFSGSYDATVIQWDLKTGQALQRFIGHLAAVYAVVTMPDDRILTASSDGTIRVWDTQNGALIKRFEGHSDIVYSVKVSPDGTQALSGSEDQSVILWDIATGSIIHQMTGHTGRVSDVAFSPDGTQALSASRDATLILWDLKSGKAIRTFVGHSAEVTSVAFSPDGRTALSGSRDKSMILWDVSSGRIIRHYLGFGDIVRSVAFSPDGRRALSASSDKLVLLWDIETGMIIQSLEGHQAAVYDAEFSRDGLYGLSGSQDKTLILWNLETGQKVRQFEGHTGDVFSVAFSNDGHSAVSSSFDGSIRLWNVDSGAELLRYDGHQGGVRSVAFSPDNHTIISGSEDTTLGEWRIDSFDEVVLWAYANRYIPELSCEQREFYRLGTQCNTQGVFATRTPYLTAVPSILSTSEPTTESTEADVVVSATTTPTLTPLPTIGSAAEIQGHLAAGARDLYVYHGHAGEVVDIQAKADNPANTVTDSNTQIEQNLLDMRLILLSPDGSILDSNDDISDNQTDSQLLGIQLPVDGDYGIQIDDSANTEVSGGYTVVINPGHLVTPLPDLTAEATLSS
ncbi:MAG: TIR domain-containing protein [Chloroflexota bacterium]